MSVLRRRTLIRIELDPRGGGRTPAEPKSGAEPATSEKDEEKDEEEQP